ncbi:GNAT family N-acetyltransferase [Bradyrhizobium sp. dw_411]|uniref:GNAT family N-acetyltransferase n=1 Tax=Bradyrhizobium sp. dw_411 TaxID=2720082 RepID=UPI001BCD6D49|nr:GNAT family N-acetyltransferase [Bradyrhizobium sp. dw_411]
MSDADKTSDVVNNISKHRYELAVEGHIAASYYTLADGVITFVHTVVPPELGGKGIGSKLIRGALDQVRSDGLKVIPECPFVKAFIEKHAAYQDLLK